MNASRARPDGWTWLTLAIAATVMISTVRFATAGAPADVKNMNCSVAAEARRVYIDPENPALGTKLEWRMPTGAKWTGPDLKTTKICAAGADCLPPSTCVAMPNKVQEVGNLGKGTGMPNVGSTYWCTCARVEKAATGVLFMYWWPKDYDSG